jgi:hypothetical protein
VGSWPDLVCIDETVAAKCAARSDRAECRKEVGKDGREEGSVRANRKRRRSDTHAQGHNPEDRDIIIGLHSLTPHVTPFCRYSDPSFSDYTTCRRFGT